MPLIIVIVLLAVLRFFELGPFADLSWWWIGGLFLITFSWFEFGVLGKVVWVSGSDGGDFVSV